MMKRIALLLASLLLLTGCAASSGASADPTPTQAPAAIYTKDMDFSFTDRELAGTWEVQKAILITGNGNTIKVDGNGASLANSQILITAPGVYRLTGTFTNLPVVVRVTDTDKVQLVLDQAELTCSNGPAILVESADKVFITLPESSASTVLDGAVYALTEDGSPDAAIFSRADLCINGTGTLTVSGAYKHGIVSKDDLVIAGCTLSISAASTGLDGKDCVKVVNAVITVEAGSNGVRSDNTEDADRGFVYLADSTIDITAGSDGVQAATVLQTKDVRLTITAGGGSSYTPRSSSGSWKGLKSGGDMLLNGGEYTISARDDCIHSNSSIVIADGAFTLSSGDDGIHANTDLTISGGEITVTKGYEGLEASKLTIAGGCIDITASDDGLNAAGGADGSGKVNRFGRGMFSNGVGEIVISGGYTVITASGDGVDSNGSILVSGGVTLVSGPVSNGNAAFDYDGSAKVTGGILIATGPMGMAQNFSEAENQGAILATFNSLPSGETIGLMASDGRVVVSFSPVNPCQCAVITAPAIQEGQSYTLLSGCTVEGADAHGFAQNATAAGGTPIAQITMTSLLYSDGSIQHMPGGPGRNPGGGWRGW